MQANIAKPSATSSSSRTRLPKTEEEKLSPKENYQKASMYKAELQKTSTSATTNQQSIFHLMLRHLIASALCYWPKDEAFEESSNTKLVLTKEEEENDKAAADAINEFRQICFLITGQTCSWVKIPLSFTAEDFIKKNQESIHAYLQKRSSTSTLSFSSQTLSSPTSSPLSSSAITTTSTAAASQSESASFSNLDADDFKSSTYGV